MVFKKTAKAGTTQKRFCGFRVGLPRLLEKLPISEQAIRKIRSANETHLLRFYFGTADTSDVDAIYTHLLISWGLAGRMSDAEAIRNEIWEAIRSSTSRFFGTRRPIRSIWFRSRTPFARRSTFGA